MSVLDIKQQFSSAQTLIINAGANADSTNAIKLVAGEDFFGNTVYANPGGNGDLVVSAKCQTAIVGSGAVLTISVYNHSAATSIDSGTLLATRSITIGAGGVAAGTTLAELRIPQADLAAQYIGVWYGVATQNITAGAVDADLVTDVEKLSTTKPS